jgi:UDP-N-acetylmuramyl pentapeptide phosphotransferase/UDP-N-acetylglucosamine-1-phosphate transferase
MNDHKYSSLVSLLQGFYYFITGIWPILNRRSFERITGPKVDFWLVRTIGGLITVIASVLIMAGVKRRTSPETAVLAIGSAGSLAASDIIYSLSGRISKIYLLESLAEFALIGLWVLGLRADYRSSRSSVLKFHSEYYLKE